MRDDRAATKTGDAPSVQAPPRPSDPVAAFLSYLIPGLGQIYQGRTAKGIVFCLCVYGLFFYGMYVGSGSVTVNGTTYTIPSNVFLPDTAEQNNPLNLPRLAANLYNRPQFLGQFWVGIAAWPAILQYVNAERNADRDVAEGWLGNFERPPSAEALNALHTSRDKLIDLGWVYTVIAGVLNILIIYDALAGPAFPQSAREPEATPEAA
jgi:hypothetical protein